jgi:hypothetical protein
MVELSRHANQPVRVVFLGWLLLPSRHATLLDVRRKSETMHAPAAVGIFM